jgi:hypothetical protein
MELFLNVLWLLIVVGVLCVWRGYWVRGRRRSRREPLQECAAITCALILLFFAISLSDDLRVDTILSDDCSIGRRHSWVSYHADRAGHSIQPVGTPILPAGALLDPQLVELELVPISPRTNTVHLSESSSNRAPPFIR